MRILLVQPDFNPGPLSFRFVAMPEPLALELLAGMIPEHEVEILDLRIDGDLVGTLERFAPDVVGVTSLTTEVHAVWQILATVKHLDPEVFTLVGGHHATLQPTDFYRETVDAVCLGEGERVFPQLIDALSVGSDLARVPNLVWRDRAGQFIHNGWSVGPLPIDRIPFPRRDLVNRYRDEYSFLFSQPHSSVTTGRGCAFRCDFCSVWAFYQGKTRQMDARRVVQEIEQTETQEVGFFDDNFLMNARREHEIADRIKAEGFQHHYGMECRTDSIVRHPKLIEKWAKLGLTVVFLGLEGSSDKDLASVNKKNTTQVNDEAIRILQANGVLVWGAFICHPDWTADQFKTLRDYAWDRELTHAQFTVLTPLLGTPLYRRCSDQLICRDHRFFDVLHAVVPTRLPREEFYQHLAGMYQRPNWESHLDLVRQGTLSIKDCRRGYEIYQAFSNWENYAKNDPILGGHSDEKPIDPLWAQSLEPLPKGGLASSRGT